MDIDIGFHVAERFFVLEVPARDPVLEATPGRDRTFTAAQRSCVIEVGPAETYNIPGKRRP